MIATLLLAGCLVLGQVDEPGTSPQPGHGSPGAGGPAEALVRAIRDNLQRIDELLLETADAEEAAGQGLESVKQAHRDVIRDLEELIQQARYRPSGQGGGGGGGESSSSSSGQPPPRESDGQRQPGSAQDPGSGSQQQPEQQGQQDGSQADGQRPENGGQQDGAARQDQAGGPPPTDPIGPFTREDVDGRWGLLPPKLQERLMNLHVDDVPERYRDWLSAYIRSLQQLEQREAGTGGGR